MVRTIALAGLATLVTVSLAVAQSSAPSSTAGGAQGTSKGGQLERPARVAPKKSTTGAAPRMQSSPESTSGGAIGTSKNPRQKN